MKKEIKEQFVADLHEKLEKAEGAFLVHYQGLNVEEMNRLRNELRKVDCELHVVKNRLLKLASDNTRTASITDYMQGPNAIALSYKDVVGPAKTLVDFSKEISKLAIRNAQISGKAIDADGVRRLANLPGRDVLLAQTLAVMQAVPTSFVRVLSAVIGNLLNVLKAIEEQKTQ